MVAGALVALVIALSGGSGGPLGSLGGGTPETPEFEFEASKTIAITTAANPDPEAPRPTTAQKKTAKKKALLAATPAAEAAIETVDTYYTAAFLDPANWQDAAYDEVFATFTDQAGDEAETQLEVMTAGSEASIEYDTITPLPSTIRTKVLLDPKGLPASVIGIAKFQASGTGASGRHVFSSKGQFVLEKIDGKWTVVSFSVSRGDKDKGAAASDGATASDAGNPGSPS